MQNMQNMIGVVDALGDGYRTINRRPLLLVLPLLLNLFIWFGAPISVAPLVNDMAVLMEQMQPADVEPGSITSDEALAALKTTDMRQALALLNAVPIIAVVRTVGEADAGAIRITSVWAVLLAFVVLNALALPLSAAFLAWVGQAVRGEQSDPNALARRILQVGLAILGVSALLAAIGVLLLMPFSILLVVLMLISQDLGGFVLTLLALAIFWAHIYLNFTNEAIVIGRLGPLRALQASFQVVRRHFWGTIGFLVVTWVIGTGCAVLWRSLVTSPVGLAAALAASAYVGCGLQAARMIYFQDRLRQWAERTQPALKGTS